MKNAIVLSLLCFTLSGHAASDIKGLDSCPLLTDANLTAAGLPAATGRTPDVNLVLAKDAEAPSDVRSDVCTLALGEGQTGAVAILVVDSFTSKIRARDIDAWLKKREEAAPADGNPAEEHKRFGQVTCEAGHYPIPSANGQGPETNQAFVACNRRVGRHHVLISLQSPAGAMGLPALEKASKLLEQAASALRKTGK